MPVIRVSDEVMKILKKFATPLEDTPDSVLRRILKDYVRIIKREEENKDKRAKNSPPPEKETSLAN
jgi:predicted transcriptional regulator